ncbi:Aspartate kinase Ask_LysC [archaeon HR06]|nr:Aspartate kinase Ask_LysC [archaeon HR06]
MENLLVLKFGGSVLEDEKSIDKASELVKSLLNKNYKLIIVISALKGVTDSLLNLAKKLNPNSSPKMLAEILAMGERTSVRLFANSLQSKGIDAVFIDPSSSLWPIVTDSDYLDANPLMDEIKGKAKGIIDLLDKGKVPIVCGFIGVNKEGEITTLGRGGSDTTAVILGSALDAKEVVLFKDVDKIYSSDPDKVKNPLPLDSLNSEEAYLLASSGSKFLHFKALQYKKDDLIIRVSSLNEGLKGTIIEGPLNFKIEVYDEPCIMLTLIKSRDSKYEDISGLISKVEALGGKILSLTLNERAIILYISGDMSIVNEIHSYIILSGLGKAISVFDKLKMITIKGNLFEKIPGLIQRFTEPLAKEGINIYGLNTISSSIKIFVSSEDFDRSVKLIKDVIAKA